MAETKRWIDWFLNLESCVGYKSSKELEMGNIKKMCELVAF